VNRLEKRLWRLGKGKICHTSRKRREMKTNPRRRGGSSSLQKPAPKGIMEKAQKRKRMFEKKA